MTTLLTPNAITGIGQVCKQVPVFNTVVFIQQPPPTQTPTAQPVSDSSGHSPSKIVSTNFFGFLALLGLIGFFRFCPPLKPLMKKYLFKSKKEDKHLYNILVVLSESESAVFENIKHEDIAFYRPIKSGKNESKSDEDDDDCDINIWVKNDTTDALKRRTEVQFYDTCNLLKGRKQILTKEIHIHVHTGIGLSESDDAVDSVERIDESINDEIIKDDILTIMTVGTIVRVFPPTIPGKLSLSLGTPDVYDTEELEIPLSPKLKSKPIAEMESKDQVDSVLNQIPDCYQARKLVHCTSADDNQCDLPRSFLLPLINPGENVIAYPEYFDDDILGEIVDDSDILSEDEGDGDSDMPLHVYRVKSTPKHFLKNATLENDSEDSMSIDLFTGYESSNTGKSLASRSLTPRSNGPRSPRSFSRSKPTPVVEPSNTNNFSGRWLPRFKSSPRSSPRGGSPRSSQGKSEGKSEGKSSPRSSQLKSSPRSSQGLVRSSPRSSEKSSPRSTSPRSSRSYSNINRIHAYAWEESMEDQSIPSQAIPKLIVFKKEIVESVSPSSSHSAKSRVRADSETTAVHSDTSAIHSDSYDSRPAFDEREVRHTRLARTSVEYSVPNTWSSRHIKVGPSHSEEPNIKVKRSERALIEVGKSERTLSRKGSFAMSSYYDDNGGEESDDEEAEEIRKLRRVFSDDDKFKCLVEEYEGTEDGDGSSTGDGDVYGDIYDGEQKGEMP